MKCLRKIVPHYLDPKKKHPFSVELLKVYFRCLFFIDIAVTHQLMEDKKSSHVSFSKSCAEAQVPIQCTNVTGFKVSFFFILEQLVQ